MTINQTESESPTPAPDTGEAVAWRSIETAPKDGQRIIGFTKFGVEVVKWHEWDGEPYTPRTGWIGVEQDSTCYPESYLRAKATYQPTHWMPLPAAPGEPLYASNNLEEVERLRKALAGLLVACLASDFNECWDEYREASQALGGKRDE